MEHYDDQIAAKVWQRVRGGSTSDNPATDISVFLQEELTDLSRYQQLSGTLGSASKPVLQQLTMITQQSISILRGIYLLLHNISPDVKPFPLPKELPVSGLRRCYGTTLARITGYDSWSAHREYGPGFWKLRELSRARCQLLLQLLGNLRSP